MERVTLILSAYVAGLVFGFIGTYTVSLNWLEKRGRWEQTGRARRNGSWNLERELERNPPRLGFPYGSCLVCHWLWETRHVLVPHRAWHVGRW